MIFIRMGSDCAPPSEHAIGIPYGCLVSDNIEGLLTSGRCIFG